MTIVLNKKAKLNICIVIFTVISLLVVSYIFYNSFQPPEKSNDKSDYIAQKVQTIVDRDETIKKVRFQTYIRKAAHVIEFGLFGISIGAVFACIYARVKRRFVSLPLLITLSVAVLDEFIQSFNERTTSIQDVLIDFAGSVGGMLLLALSIYVAIHIKKKRGEKNQLN